MAVATTADLEEQDNRRLERYRRGTYRSFLLAAVGFIAPSLAGLVAAYDDGHVGVPVVLAVIAGLALLTWYYARLVRTGLDGGASRRDIAAGGAVAAVLSLMLLTNPLFNLIAVIWVSAVVLSPMSRRQIAALCLGTAAYCSALTTISARYLYPDGGMPWYGLLPMMFAVYVAACGFVVFCNRYQRRMWEMHQETYAARGALARLAVTEERLRFSRDLHDLLGHSLSLIAVKSELAMRTVGADPDRAVAEMADVRRTAREALREVRAAVNGYRAVELDAELAGARAVLEAAGIRCEIGDLPGALPPEVRAVLAWVIREGTTNVIKHSEARHCTVTLTSHGDSVALEMRNDGARGGDDADGAGLTGLAERVAVLGGEITSGRHGRADFVLRAVVPLPAPAPAEAVPGDTASAKAVSADAVPADAVPADTGGSRA
ncbi:MULTISPECIES: sensor histidine kinase [unclassified Spirillospora]|uniref:sensor histidine kinase n=1 Tax=unclassified Spirillospora TaxID=2642701 RepID=UPI0037231457